VTAAPQAPDARRWLMLPVLLAATFMAQFDLYVVNVAAPSLRTGLDAGPAALELIVGGYAFMYATGLITGGRLGDLYSHRRVFLWGTLAFTVASLLCGLANTAGQLVGYRLLQGLTAAAMVPQVLAAISAVFPPQERPRALAWFGVVMGVGAVAGQVLGGALLVGDLFGLGWRIIFLVNVPIGLAAIVGAAFLLPRTSSQNRPKLDPLGTVLVSGSLALALVPLVLGRTEGWPTWIWVSLALSVPTMIVALLWERALANRGGQPLLELALFRDRVFNYGLAVNIGAFASFHSFMFTLTLVLQGGFGLTPLQAGLMFCPLGIAFSVASIVAPRIIARQGARVITAGTTIAAVGLFLLLVTLWMSDETTSALLLVVPMTIVGFGNGLAVPALIGAVLSGVRSRQAGAGAGILTTSQQFASAIGIAAFGGVFFAALGTGTGVLAYTSAFRWEVVLSLVVAALAALLSLRLPRPPAPAR
jgi:Arabinose efflux permease